MNDSGDDWLFESVRRYNRMSIFDFEQKISHVERSDHEHLCTVRNYHHMHKDEIKEVTIPGGFLTNNSTHSLHSDGDMKFQPGALLTSIIFQVKAVPNKRKLISSEEDTFGVSIYDLGEPASGNIERLHEYSSDHFKPRFSFNGLNHIIMATTSEKPLTLIDMSTGQVVRDIQFEKTTGKASELEPEFMTENLSAICDKRTGTVHVKDSRGHNDTTTFEVRDFAPFSAVVDASQMWTITAPFQQSTMTQPISGGDIKFACVSTEGLFFAYDIRNSKSVLYMESIHERGPGSYYLSMKVNSSFNRFILTGYDEKVHVHDVDAQGKVIPSFVHDGHDRMTKYDDFENVVKCQMFLTDDVILSVDDTMSMHCWQFVPHI